jgi:hypothetical protein
LRMLMSKFVMKLFFSDIVTDLVTGHFDYFLRNESLFELL